MDIAVHHRSVLFRAPLRGWCRRWLERFAAPHRCCGRGGVGCIIQNYDELGNPDGFVVVGGNTFDTPEGSLSNILVLKLNNDGSVACQKTYDLNLRDFARAIKQTIDGRYIVAGNAYSFVDRSNIIWVLRLNPDCSIIWQKTYGGEANEENPRAIEETFDQEP